MEFGLVEISAIIVKIGDEAWEGAVLGVEGEEGGDRLGNGVAAPGGAIGLLTQKSGGIGVTLISRCAADKPKICEIKLAGHGSRMGSVGGDGLG